MKNARRLLPLLLVLALSSLGCSRHDRVLAPTALDPSSLGSHSFHVVAKNANESIILLGQLDFAPLEGNAIQGTWSLRQWSGNDIPTLPGNGTMTGTVFGKSVILALELPGSSSSLGVVADRVVDGRVTGTIALLPSRSFTGSFEAIAATP